MNYKIDLMFFRIYRIKSGYQRIRVDNETDSVDTVKKLKKFK